MFNNHDFQERYQIIKTSSLDDVLILDENYTRMIKETVSDEERDQIRRLKLMIRTKIDLEQN